MYRLAGLLSLALPLALGAAAAPAVPASGLAFAVALKGSGEILASGPFLLRVPGAKGTLRLELSGLESDGASLRGDARLRNDTGLLLAGLELDFKSASATRGPTTGQAAAAGGPVSLKEPVSFGDLLDGETTPYVSFDLSPIPLGADVTLTTLLGAISGLAVEPAVAIAGAVRPVALDADRSGRIYVATAGVGRVLRLTAASAASPSEAARPASPPAGLALRRKNGDLLVSTGGQIIEVHRPGVMRAATLNAGRPVKTLRIDAKNVLRAASGNAVLAFDEAKPGVTRVIGPTGSEVVSFDTDAHGTIYAVVLAGTTRRVVFAGETGPAPFPARKGVGSDADNAPTACRFDAAGTLWIAAESRTPEGTVVARFLPDGTPLAALSRLALGLLFGKEEAAPVPAVVDLAPGSDGRLYVLLEDGSVFEIRPL